MAIVYLQMLPEEASFLATAFPQFVKNNGSNFPVTGLAFDAASDEAAFWKFLALHYGSGNVFVTLLWYADTASSGDVVWEAQIAAITAGLDSQDIETKAFAAITSLTATHLGTVGQRLHGHTITLTNLDALAVSDYVTLRIARDANNAADTLAGDAILVLAIVAWSDV